MMNEKIVPGVKKDEYRYFVYELDLTVARNDVQFATGLMNTLLVREIQDINSNVKLKFQMQANEAISLRAQDTYNFKRSEISQNYFDKVFITNDAVAAGVAILIFAYNIDIRTLTRLTADMIQNGILSSVVTVGVAATPIPAVAMTERINLLISNTSANTIYIGDTTVTIAGATQGLPVAAGDKVSFTIAQGVTLYGIAALNSDINVLEGS